MSCWRLLAWRGLAGLGLLAACQPGLNWREVRPEGMPLIAAFPCKPENSHRHTQLAGSTLDMRLASCSAMGGTYGVSYASLPPGADVGAALAHWRKATLAHVTATEVVDRPGADLMPLAKAQRQFALRARGRAPTGEALEIEAWWFARGDQVFQAAVYTQAVAVKALPEFREPFFEGLRLQ